MGGGGGKCHFPFVSGNKYVEPALSKRQSSDLAHACNKTGCCCYFFVLKTQSWQRTHYTAHTAKSTWHLTERSKTDIVAKAGSELRDAGGQAGGREKNGWLGAKDKSKSSLTQKGLPRGWLFDKNLPMANRPDTKALKMLHVTLLGFSLWEVGENKRVDCETNTGCF